jgi:hypothetical protein
VCVCVGGWMGERRHKGEEHQKKNAIHKHTHTYIHTHTHRHTAASILAGDSSLGSESMEMTDTMMASTPKMGRQRSSADS